MNKITDKDIVYLRASKFDIVKIVGVLLTHLLVALILLSFIANFLLKPSFILGTVATVLISSVMLTSAIWLTLRWAWSRITINHTTYRFVGKVYPLFGMVLAIAIILILAEATLGAVIVVLFNSQYVGWKLILTIIALVVLVAGLIFTARQLKQWVNRNILPQQKDKERIA